MEGLQTLRSLLIDELWADAVCDAPPQRIVVRMGPARATIALRDRLAGMVSAKGWAAAGRAVIPGASWLLPDADAAPTVACPSWRIEAADHPHRAVAVQFTHQYIDALNDIHRLMPALCCQVVVAALAAFAILFLLRYSLSKLWRWRQYQRAARALAPPRRGPLGQREVDQYHRQAYLLLVLASTWVVGCPLLASRVADAVVNGEVSALTVAASVINRLAPAIAGSSPAHYVIGHVLLLYGGGLYVTVALFLVNSALGAISSPTFVHFLAMRSRHD